MRALIALLMLSLLVLPYLLGEPYKPPSVAGATMAIACGCAIPITKLALIARAAKDARATYRTTTLAGPASSCPMMAASAKPSSRKICSIRVVACGAQATRSPPDVWGSVNTARSATPIRGNSATSSA